MGFFSTDPNERATRRLPSGGALKRDTAATLLRDGSTPKKVSRDGRGGTRDCRPFPAPPFPRMVANRFAPDGSPTLRGESKGRRRFVRWCSRVRFRRTDFQVLAHLACKAASVDRLRN